MHLKNFISYFLVNICFKSFNFHLFSNHVKFNKYFKVGYRVFIFLQSTSQCTVCFLNNHIINK